MTEIEKPQDSDEFLELVQLAGELTDREYPRMIEVPYAEEFVWEFGGWREVLAAAGFKPRGEKRSAIPNTQRDGYERLGSVHHHRLLGTLLVDDIAELKDKHIHHENEIPWDNRLENIEVLTPGEHSMRHGKMGKMREANPAFDN